MDSRRVFKDWVKPGPLAPGGLEPSEDESLDAISGDYRLFQLKKGHRFSTDDLLAAWYGTLSCPRAETVLDLGSGIGTVGMIAAWRLPGARLVTVEAQEQSVLLARKSARFNGVESRYEIRQGDFRDPGVLREDEVFDLVLGSPPYFPMDAGIHGDHPQKTACRFEMRGDVSDYCKVAAKHLGPGGVFACVFPDGVERQRDRVFAGARAAGLVITRVRRVELKEGESAGLAVFAMQLKQHLPPAFRERTFEEPPLVIRLRDGAVSSEYSVVKLSIGFPP